MNPASGGVPVMDFKSALQENLQATGRQASYVLSGEEVGQRVSARRLRSKSGYPRRGRQKLSSLGAPGHHEEKKAEQNADRQVLEIILAAFPGAAEGNGVQEAVDAAYPMMTSSKPAHENAGLVNFHAVAAGHGRDCCVRHHLHRTSVQIPSVSMENTPVHRRLPAKWTSFCYGGEREPVHWVCVRSAEATSSSSTILSTRRNIW